MITFETRLRIDADQESLISGLCYAHTSAVRRCLALMFRDGLSTSEVYHQLKSEGQLTSHQIGSAQNIAEMLYKRQLEADKYLKSKIEGSIKARKAAITSGRRGLPSLKKQLASQQALALMMSPSKTGKRLKAYTECLAKVRALSEKADKKSNWLKMKESGLEHKQRQLAQLSVRLDEKRVSICFGSRKLLAQNPSNNKNSDFESYESWRAEWDLRRNNQIVSIARKTSHMETLRFNGTLRAKPFGCD